MKIFVINLKRATVRKEQFLKNWAFFANELSFFNAIDGKDLSTNELSKCSVDYPHLKLTKGEIACALSHLALYRKIVKEKISMALILEDDAILKKNINHQHFSDLLNKMEQTKSIPPNSVIFIQNGAKTPCCENGFSCQLTETLCLEEMSSVWLSHAYIITLGAARKLARFIPPIRYEADFWEAHRIGAGVRLLAITPALIESSDPHFKTSTLHQERLPLASDRANIRTKLLKREIELARLRKQFKLFPINRFIKKNKFFPLNKFFINLIAAFRKN